MNWEAFYLICFLVGIALSVISLFTGTTHLHLPHAHIHSGSSHGFGLINFGTIAAFLVWFGGTGYLLAHYSVWFLIVLGIRGRQRGQRFRKR